MKAYCFFEQSGTFKNAFIKLGIPAEDFDIINDFGETDHILDLFEEIRKAYAGEPSVFDEITPSDLIMAFFPCTRFEDQITLYMRGEFSQQSKWPITKKLEYSMKLNNELNNNYLTVSKLAHIAYTRGLRLIIENPQGTCHYLTRYWCLKPTIIDRDRSRRGDYFRKPTQYFFINIEPKYNFFWYEQREAKAESWHNPKKVMEAHGVDRKTARSMIAPEYAENFIKEYILEPVGTNPQEEGAE